MDSEPHKFGCENTFSLLVALILSQNMCMGKVFSIVNQKGGVGKTTLTFNLGTALHMGGCRVLLIDNDPQGNLTSYAGVDPQFTMDEVYISRRNTHLKSSELVDLDEGLSLLPADNMLAGVEHYLAVRDNKEYILRNALQDIREEFDFILIDNPPALNLLTVNGLVASNEVLIPVQLEFFSLEGIVGLEKTMERLLPKNPELKLGGIVPNMFDDRRKLNWEVLAALKKEFGDKVFNTKIHDCVKIAESSGHGRSVLKYSPKSRSAMEYIQVAEEMMAHGK